MNRGLASSAALSGLFQPYSVGKFNITAGVGGFRDESAIAVGTGSGCSRRGGALQHIPPVFLTYGGQTGAGQQQGEGLRDGVMSVQSVAVEPLRQGRVGGDGHALLGGEVPQGLVQFPGGN
ncbi:YadA-like family protein [Salmonella enterica]